MVDDSHATGFVGKTGRGSVEHNDVFGRVDIITGTLGKALGGASGGFTSGTRKSSNCCVSARARTYSAIRFHRHCRCGNRRDGHAKRNHRTAR